MAKALDLPEFGLGGDTEAEEVSGEMKAIAGQLMKLPYCDMQQLSTTLAKHLGSDSVPNCSFTAGALVAMSREILASPSPARPEKQGVIYRDPRPTHVR